MPEDNKPPSFMQSVGLGIAPTVAGGIIGLLAGKAQDKRQINQQKKLQALQIAGSKELADYNYSKQLEMWKATNYGAQMEELEKAGLNPGLIYGMSGGGGVTTGSGGGSVTGATASQGGGGELGLGLQMATQAAQLAIMEAQKKNIEADTANKTADTANKGTQGEILKLEEEFKALTLDASVAKKHYETNQAMHEAALKWVDRYIAENGADTRAYNASDTAALELEEMRVRVAGLYLQNIQTKENTALTQAQQQQVLQNIRTQIKQLQQGDRALDQKDQDILIDKARNELIETGIWVGAASNIAGDLVKMLLGKKGGKK